MGVTWLRVCPLCYCFPPSLPVSSQPVGKAFSGSPPLPIPASLHPAITLPRYFHSCWFSCIPFKLFGREKKGKVSCQTVSCPSLFGFKAVHITAQESSGLRSGIHCSAHTGTPRDWLNSMQIILPGTFPPSMGSLAHTCCHLELAGTLSLCVSLSLSHTHSGQGSGLHTCILCPSLASRGSAIWRLSIQALEKDCLGSEPTSLSR